MQIKVSLHRIGKKIEEQGPESYKPDIDWIELLKNPTWLRMGDRGYNQNVVDMRFTAKYGQSPVHRKARVRDERGFSTTCKRGFT